MLCNVSLPIYLTIPVVVNLAVPRIKDSQGKCSLILQVTEFWRQPCHFVEDVRIIGLFFAHSVSQRVIHCALLFTDWHSVQCRKIKIKAGNRLGS